MKAFRAEGELIGAYAELLQRVPSLTFIEALEDSRALVRLVRFQAEHPHGPPISVSYRGPRETATVEASGRICALDRASPCA